MRRKSERNKAKGSPEKKVEKPTRKSARRRGKRSPSTSSEQDNVEEPGTSAPSSKEPGKEPDKVQTRLQAKEQEQASEGQNEKVSPVEKETKPESPQDEEENNGKSVWTVSRADASPGEIQKLKLCRERNTSDGSPDTSSLSRKKSNKWQESGEGVAEEVDSADEQLVSCTRMHSSNEPPNDPSSSYPGQDSNEEVSDSKEILPETTSANLSDDKPNIDQQGDSNEANSSNQNVDSEPASKPSSAIALAPSSNGDYTPEENPTDATTTTTTTTTASAAATATTNSTTTTSTTTTPREEKSAEEEKSMESFSKETSVENVQKDSRSDAEEECEEKRKLGRLDSTSESNDETHDTDNRTSSVGASRVSRRKHRNKYHDSSNSETPDSEDEPSIERKVVTETYIKAMDEEEEEEEAETKDSQEQKERSVSPKPRNNSIANNMEMEIEQCDGNKQKPEIANEHSEYGPLTSNQTATYKPVKVNLKRSFSARMLLERPEQKTEDADSATANEASSQNKENYNSDQEPKCVPRKRRWGTALSTDTAPSFSISTDSLKALVPGAKPLPINEVRLSKDDDEERERYRGNEKWHGLGLPDDVNDNKANQDDGLAQKNGAAKKGEGKMDNHIAARRKISIVKETPHVKSPSPPATKPTNILLIKNLVRPFTLNQIKELLSRTGTIAENGFWMDRIKSKCFVEYANEDQAFETRQALHGISWPVSNPKRLHVEYATKDDMELAQELSKDHPIQRKTEPLVPSESWQQEWGREDRTNATKVTIVREWDLGKEDGQQHVKEKEREKKDHEKKRRQRSRSPALEAHLPAPARKFKKKEDDPPPAKLLDDLFRKTKTSPCIYWLPLTNEQIVVKEEMRRQHMAEHARRLEEMRRAERNRDGRRRRSPRK